MRREDSKTSLPVALLLAAALALLACGDAVTPTQPTPLTAPVAATSALGGSSVVAPGAAHELMLRARGETAGPFGGALLGTAWVHVTGEPETASVEVVTTGVPGPDGVPTRHTFTFGSGDYFRTEDLAVLDPPFAGPGEYSLSSTVTIVEGSGDFAGMTGILEITKGTLTVSPEFVASAEWTMKGRVRLGG